MTRTGDNWRHAPTAERAGPVIPSTAGDQRATGSRLTRSCGSRSTARTRLCPARPVMARRGRGCARSRRTRRRSGAPAWRFGRPRRPARSVTRIHTTGVLRTLRRRRAQRATRHGPSGRRRWTPRATRRRGMRWKGHIGRSPVSRVIARPTVLAPHRHSSQRHRVSPASASARYRPRVRAVTRIHTAGGSLRLAGARATRATRSRRSLRQRDSITPESLAFRSRALTSAPPARHVITRR